MNGQVTGPIRAGLRRGRPLFTRPLIQAAIEQRRLIAMSQVVHGEEEACRHGIPVRRVVDHAGVVADPDLLKILLQLVGRQQLGSGCLVPGGELVHRQISRPGNMGREIVALIVADVHDHQVGIGKVVGQPLRGNHQLRMSRSRAGRLSGRVNSRQSQQGSSANRDNSQKDGIAFHRLPPPNREIVLYRCAAFTRSGTGETTSSLPAACTHSYTEPSYMAARYPRYFATK